jgi:AcrR family transcriptional regulator
MGMLGYAARHSQHRSVDYMDIRTKQTRGRMVAGAADLICRRGVNATSFREVVRHTQTPRGSIKHHFPHGKRQLVEEAVVYAGLAVGAPLERLMNELGVIAGLRAFIESWRKVLESTHYEAGCPVLAVAVEQYIGDDNALDAETQARLLDLARDAFDGWQRTVAASLRREGVSPARAGRLATLVVSSIEGAVALCRAARNAQALDDVRAELELILSSVLKTKASR